MSCRVIKVASKTATKSRFNSQFAGKLCLHGSILKPEVYILNFFHDINHVCLKLVNTLPNFSLLLVPAGEGEYSSSPLFVATKYS